MFIGFFLLSRSEYINMFTHSFPLKTELRTVKGVEFEFIVYRAQETEEVHVHVVRNGSGVGILSASLEVMHNMAHEGKDVVEELINQAIYDIEHDEDGQYLA